MLAKEYCDCIKKKDKPVIISHHMLMGLKEGQEKMSKRDPDSAIFMEDSVADVNRKLKKAFCPEKVIANNPIVDYCKSILFPSFGHVEVHRSPENGGYKCYNTYEELCRDFEEGALHPKDLKTSCADGINKLLQPVRDHFANDPYAKKLLDTIKGWQKEIDAKKAQEGK